MTSNNPYADLVDAVRRAIKYPMPIKVHVLTEDGDVRFSVPFSAFGWESSSLDSLTFCLPLIGSLVGTILVNSHPKCFDSVILSKNYTACSKFKHLGFGLKSRGQDFIDTKSLDKRLRWALPLITQRTDQFCPRLINVPVTLLILVSFFYQMSSFARQSYITFANANTITN